MILANARLVGLDVLFALFRLADRVLVELVRHVSSLNGARGGSRVALLDAVQAPNLPTYHPGSQCAADTEMLGRR